MTLRLIIARHAKSSWKNAGVSDHDRPLNGRGRREAPMLGDAIRMAGWVPDVILSSDAQRTQETCEAFRESFPGVPCHFLRSLYLAHPETLFEEVTSLSPDIGTALLLGHNPGSSEFVSILAGMPVELKTANAALLEYPSDNWAEAALSRAWTLVAHMAPQVPESLQL